MKLNIVFGVIAWILLFCSEKTLAQQQTELPPADVADAGQHSVKTANANATDAVSTTNLMTVTVQGKQTKAGSGLISELLAPKAASVVTDQYIKDQAAGSNPFQLLELTPGVNENGRGQSGLDRGQISVRGFQSTQLGFSLEGVPLNDSGTFNIFPQEYIDTENLRKIFISQGSGDVDSPNIGATGGVVGMLVKRPADNFQVQAVQSEGENRFRRTFVRIDTGVFADNSRAFISFSDSAVDQWRGIGRSWREHLDAMIVHDIDANNHLSLDFFYNNDVLGQYEALTKAQINQYGYGFNFAPRFSPLTPASAGGSENDNNSAALGANALLQRSNFNGLQYNPFESLVLTGKANLTLSDQVHVDLQPYLWFGRGNGGGGSYVSESNSALLGAPKDINGNGNTQDNLLFFNPFTQEQTRPGFISRLKWDVSNQELVFGFHYERSRLSEWRPLIAINPETGIPTDYWANVSSELVRDSFGVPIRNQNQVTVSSIVRPFFGDTIHLLDEKLLVTLGLQYPVAKRNGENLLPLALRTSNGEIAPVYTEMTQRKLMPSMGAVYSLSDTHSLFASIAQTFRATDNVPLYQPGANLAAIKPETAIDTEMGYRFAGTMLIGAATIYNINYMNREQTLFDATANNTVSKNIGDVLIQGIELELGSKPYRGFSLYASGAINTSTIKNDLAIGISGQTNTLLLPTAGKQLTDLPRCMLAGRLRYEDGAFFSAIESRYTSMRYATLVNDETVAANTVVDFSAGYKLPRSWAG
ncbi:MAG TPA: TonB-dependent receptor, partial [Burkholderiaceae bacterium]|nr:TonB-dependent receptor [Burkholderiaceae bacterium]